MNIKTVIFVITIAAICFCQSVYAQDTNPDHQKLIKASHFLEENPLDKNAKAIRSWAFVWAAIRKTLP